MPFFRAISAYKVHEEEQRVVKTVMDTDYGSNINIYFFKTFPRNVLLNTELADSTNAIGKFQESSWPLP